MFYCYVCGCLVLVWGFLGDMVVGSIYGYDNDYIVDYLFYGMEVVV